MTTAFISHPACQAHNMGANHPESPSRLQAIESHFADTGLLDELISITAQPVENSALLRAHPQSYLTQLQELSPDKGLVYADPDTALNRHSLKAAKLAAGAATQAVDLVANGQCQRVFCAVRPPGHHAERNQVMGFCLFNNIAIAALHALNTGVCERLAIVDFDVHQGNGTVDIFKDDPRVLFCSSFQFPFYPFRYQQLDRPNIINTPLSENTGSQLFRKSIEQQWLPALQNFKPQLVLISAGFDAHRDDPLAQLQLVDDDYRWITELIVSVADTYAGGKIVSMLEGGYNLSALARSSFQHVMTLNSGH